MHRPASMKLIFDEQAWDEYLRWQSLDKKTLKRINSLIADIQRHSFDGIGKPEPLRYQLAGFWSRRIDEKNRIVYRVVEDRIEIVSLCSHYGDH